MEIKKFNEMGKDNKEILYVSELNIGDKFVINTDTEIISSLNGNQHYLKKGSIVKIHRLSEVPGDIPTAEFITIDGIIGRIKGIGIWGEIPYKLMSKLI